MAGSVANMASRLTKGKHSQFDETEPLSSQICHGRWDPVTGLGSVNFGRLQNELLTKGIYTHIERAETTTL